MEGQKNFETLIGGDQEVEIKTESEELKSLLVENLKYSRAIYKDVQKMRRYMFWRMIINIFWIILVIAPIIIAVIYLPPALMGLYESYQELLGEGQGSLDLINQLNQFQ